MSVAMQKKTDHDCLLSLMTEAMTVEVVTKSWFHIGLLKNIMRNNLDKGKYETYNGFRYIEK